VSTTEPARGDRTVVEFPASDGYRSVGRLVVGGIASRFDLPVDRVDDLLLAIESVFLQGTAGDTLLLVADATPDDLRVSVGPLGLTQLQDPALQRVLTRLVDHVETRAEGDTGRIELVVAATYRQRPSS
jgi:hypothetical protein